MAYWMHANDKAIYNCTFAPAEYKIPGKTKLSYNPATKRLYIFIYDYPTDGKLIMPGYDGKISYAQFLNDKSELLYKTSGNGDVELKLPLNKPLYEIPVIELALK